MRLVSQHKRPMRQAGLPASPTRSTLDRAEHSLLRRVVEDSILWRETEPVQLRLDGLGAFRANDGDLVRTQLTPLSQQMAAHGSLAPGQEQFRAPHPLRTSSAQD